MPKFVIPVTYTMYGKYTIEADTIEEALDKVLDENLPLPNGSGYVEDSIEVNEEDVRENNTLSEEELFSVSDYLAERYRQMHD